MKRQPASRCRAQSAVDTDHLETVELSTVAQDNDAMPPGGTTDAFVNLWIVIWLSTAAGGGLFGVFVALVGSLPTQIEALVFGSLLAASAGVLVIPTVWALGWMIWLHRLPRIQAFIAGAATGFTCAYGAFGQEYAVGAGALVVGGISALAGAEIFIKFAVAAYPIRAATRIRNERKLPSPHYSILDLFARVTVAAILIVVWTTVFSWNY